jgi:hypothetical protein
MNWKIKNSWRSLQLEEKKENSEGRFLVLAFLCYWYIIEYQNRVLKWCPVFFGIFIIKL